MADIIGECFGYSKVYNTFMLFYNALLILFWSWFILIAKDYFVDRSKEGCRDRTGNR